MENLSLKNTPFLKKTWTSLCFLCTALLLAQEGTHHQKVCVGNVQVDKLKQYIYESGVSTIYYTPSSPIFKYMEVAFPGKHPFFLNPRRLTAKTHPLFEKSMDHAFNQKYPLSPWNCRLAWLPF